MSDDPKTPKRGKPRGTPNEPGTPGGARARKPATSGKPQPAKTEARTANPPGRAEPGPAPVAPESPVPAAAPPAVEGLRGRLYRIPILGAVIYLVSPPRSGPPSIARRAISWTSGLALVLGLGMVFYPIAGERYPGFYRVPVEKAIEWTNFLSDMQANKLQKGLKEQYAAAVTLKQPTVPGEGEPLTRLQIPKLGVDAIVVEGTSPSALKAGAGHYPQTPLPGHVGNVAIAGHRTTYGRPFNRVDELRPGDVIRLSTPLGSHTYEVTAKPWITSPDDWSVIEGSGDPILTLTTCHPKGSAKQRLIVRAKLVRSAPA